mmetsp:Transcript_1056/g.2162  ORF Transcript_1056/g.2162 Transcript_1056/m.2162 type:complete len:293 (+) Transcript_1056:578-1456(+)
MSLDAWECHSSNAIDQDITLCAFPLPTTTSVLGTTSLPPGAVLPSSPSYLETQPASIATEAEEGADMLVNLVIYGLIGLFVLVVGCTLYIRCILRNQRQGSVEDEEEQRPGKGYGNIGMTETDTPPLGASAGPPPRRSSVTSSGARVRPSEPGFGSAAWASSVGPRTAANATGGGGSLRPPSKGSSCCSSPRSEPMGRPSQAPPSPSRSSQGSYQEPPTPPRLFVSTEPQMHPEAEVVQQRMRELMDEALPVRKKVFKELMLEYHPDKNKDAHATEVFQLINNARGWFLSAA